MILPLKVLFSGLEFSLPSIHVSYILPKFLNLGFSSNGNKILLNLIQAYWISTSKPIKSLKWMTATVYIFTTFKNVLHRPAVFSILIEHFKSKKPQVEPAGWLSRPAPWSCGGDCWNECDGWAWLWLLCPCRTRTRNPWSLEEIDKFVN